MRSLKSRQLAGPTKKKILTTLGLVFLVLTSFFGGYFSQYALRGEGEQVVSDILHVMDQVGFVYDADKDEYVKLDEDKIARLIAGNFLDGYSRYYTKEEYEELQKKNKGNYTNFGINMTTNNSNSLELDTNVISGVSLNSPAHLAGLKAGDKIVAISVNGGQLVTVTTGAQLDGLLKSAVENDEYQFHVDGGVEPITVQKKSYSRCYVTYEDSEVNTFFSPVYGERVNSVSDAYESIVETSKWQVEEGGEENEEQLYGYGETVILATYFTKEGFDFEGWYASEDLSGEQVLAIDSLNPEDITLYAKWTAKPVVNNGGNTGNGCNSSVQTTVAGAIFSVISIAFFILRKKGGKNNG